MSHSIEYIQDKLAKLGVQLLQTTSDEEFKEALKSFVKQMNKMKRNWREEDVGNPQESS